MSTPQPEALEPAEPATITPAPLISLECDFAEDGRFGRRCLQVTPHQVCVLDADGTVTFHIPVSDIKTARNEPLVGGGRLEITTRRGEILKVCTYSLSLAPQFSEAARGIEQLAEGRPLSINLKQERTRCAKCRRLLPEKDGVCPACVNRRRTMLRIAGFMAPYKKQACMLTGISLLSTATLLAPPILQGALVDQVLIPRKNLGMLTLLMSLWLATLLINVGLQIASGRLVAFLGANIAADLRSRVYRAVELLRLTYFDKKPVGAITSRITQDTDRVWGFLVDGVPYFVTNGLLLVGITLFLFITNPLLAACILAPIPVVVLISGVAWKPVSQLYHRVGQKWARFHMHLNESITGIRVVKAFVQEDSENEKFLRRNGELRDAGIRADNQWFTIFGMLSFFAGLGSLINWSVGGWMVYHGTLSLGQFWKAHMLLGLIYGPLQWFAQVNNWFSRAMAGAERVFEVIDSEPEAYFRGEQMPRRRIQGEVAFDAVRFGYDKSNPVLKGITFTAEPGEMIGLVGKSGAGKSTTINLLCRFYEPDSGEIRIDGIPYSGFALQDLREQIGIVLQEPFLFNGTIAENIAYGRPGATFSEIVQAARAANAHGFILSKPDGYDTIVGERGAKLSGGERQRISIARAILHNPRILILDEATSSVDVETEKQIQEAIGRLIEGRTTFAIAHRLSTLRNATRLIVLDKGEVVEIGTHAELMEKQGVFYSLVQTQSAIQEIVGIGQGE